MNQKTNVLFIFSLVLILSQNINVFAQEMIIDQVVGIVGDNMILLSDIEKQYQQMRAQGYTSKGDAKCEIFEDFLSQKLLVAQAKIDSVQVSSGEVELQLNNRMDFFIEQIGSEEELEAYFNKTIIEIKEDLRDAIKEQMVTQKMQGEIIGEVKVTPSDVKEYFNSLPKDSVPIINSQLEIKEIVLHPDYSDEAIFSVKERLLDLRKRILDGESFATLAVLYSEDGSATRGGEIGFMGKGELDPEYAKTAFGLKKGGISTIVESEFGYHIIQLIDRKDDKVNTRHILIKPRISPVAITNAKSKLDSLSLVIKKDSISFERAALIYSQDKKSRMSGGVRINQKNLTTRFAPDDFAPAEYYVLRDLAEGEISKPYESIDETGKKVYKIVKLVKRYEPHVANLKSDYDFLKESAIQSIKEKKLQNWLNEKIESTYVRIDDGFKKCEYQNKGWLK